MLLDEIKDNPSEYEVLVDCSAFVLDGGRQWVDLRKLTNAKFPVITHVPEVGKAAFRREEIIDVRPRGGDA